MQLCESRHSVKSLNDIEAAELGLNGNLFTARELGGNRRLAAEEGFAGLDMAIDCRGNPRNAFEVLDIRGNNDVYVLCSANDSPGIDSQPADQYELDICFREPSKELIEGHFGQCGRAVPTNCINLWLSSIPSARLMFMGRRASSRSRWTRTASAAAAPLRALPDF